MVQTFKIVKGIDGVDNKTIFQLATDGGKAIRSADRPLNQKDAKELFSNRVIDNWNLNPSDVKNERTVTSFKRSFKKHRRACFLPHSRGKETGVKMEMWRTTRCGHLLRGPSGAIGSSTPSKPVSSVADPWHFGVDPDPDLDPRIHASDQWIRIRMRIRILLFFLIDLQDASKN
jgi:hypothetical protein